MIASKKFKQKLKGEFTIMFLALGIPLFMLMMVIVYDMGNYLLMRGTTRSLADSIALAVSGSVDMSGQGLSTASNYTLNNAWAQARAREIYTATINGSRTALKRMDFTQVTNVSGQQATVVVTGTYHPVWNLYSDGEDMKSISVTKSRAASGIYGEVD